MNIKAITLDTGGTIFDWHAGVCAALKRVGDGAVLLATGRR
jgi:FMN phosphatase YigB (HAD superfamily)